MAFIDADCVADPGWLTAMIAPLHDPRVGVVGGRILSPAGGNRVERFGELIHDQQRGIEAEDPPYVDTASWASRREVLLEAGLFDETLFRGHDVDLAWRIHRSGLRLVYAPDAIVRHRHERTVFGLMHEGYVHGRHGVGLNLKHTHVWPQVRRRWTGSVSRLTADLRAITRGPAPMDSLLRFLFDAGKSTGELVAFTEGSPDRRPRGRPPASFLFPFRPIRRRHVLLLGQLASIQHRLLDQSTWLGYLWSFLNPLLMLLVLWAFFSRRHGEAVPHYAIYLLIGIVQFTHFSKTVSTAMRVLPRMRKLAVGVIFPKDVLIYSALLADLPEFLISIVLTVAIALLSGVQPSWALLALPLVLTTQLLLVLWCSLLLSTAYVVAHDLDHLFEIGMRLLFFMTPIFYSLESLSPALRSVAMLNPLTHTIGFTRLLLLDGRLPPTGYFLGFLTLNAAMAFCAVAIFRQAEPRLLERL